MWICDVISQLFIALLIGAAGGVLIWGVMEVMGEADKKFERYCSYNPQMYGLQGRSGHERHNRIKRSDRWNDYGGGDGDDYIEVTTAGVDLTGGKETTKSGTKNGTESGTESSVSSVTESGTESGIVKGKKATFDQVRPLVQFEILMSAGGLAVLNAIFLIILMIMICVGHPTEMEGEGDETKKEQVKEGGNQGQQDYGGPSASSSYHY